LDVVRLKRICLLGFLVSSGLFGASAKTSVPRHFRVPLNSLGTLISADLDGNGSMDWATAGASRHDGGGYVQDITVRLSSSASSTVAVHTAGLPLRLRVFDLDGDSDRDLVVEAFDRSPLAVLLNDGDGNFHEAVLDDFRERLRDQDSHSLEAPVPSSDSSEIGESAPSPVARHDDADLQPYLTGSRLVMEHRRLRPMLAHWGRSSRGPPLSF